MDRAEVICSGLLRRCESLRREVTNVGSQYRLFFAWYVL